MLSAVAADALYVASAGAVLLAESVSLLALWSLMLLTCRSRAVGLVGVAAGALVVNVVDLQEPDVVGGRC